MNIRELQQAYENKMKDIKGFIYKQTRENKDMRQEACLAMWRGLLKDPGGHQWLFDEPHPLASYGCLEA